jgi:hypothetical protein
MMDSKQFPAMKLSRLSIQTPETKEILGARRDTSSTTSCMRSFVKTDFQIKERRSLRRTFRG